MKLDVQHPAGPSGHPGQSDSSCLIAPAGSPAVSEPGTADVLIAARKLIEDRADWSCEGWGFGGKRCALHAICDANGLAPGASSSSPETKALERAAGGGWIGDFNDTHTHAEVLNAFDRAIYNALEGF